MGERVGGASGAESPDVGHGQLDMGMGGDSVVGVRKSGEVGEGTHMRRRHFSNFPHHI